MSDDVGAQVGSRIKELRTERAMTLSALAAAAGIGKGSLSEIESGSRNPTLATLYAVAGPLGVPLTTLLDDRVGARVASDGVTARLLDARHHDDGSTVEVYELELEHGRTRTSPAHGAGVVEHLLVTRGRMSAGRIGREIEIGPGESAQWVSDVVHSYRAIGDTGAEGVLVIRTSAG